MTDATTPKTIIAPVIAAAFVTDGMPSPAASDGDASSRDVSDIDTSAKDMTVKEMQPTSPDLCNVLSCGC